MTILASTSEYLVEYEARLFTIARGGYVRQGADHSANNPQVCEGLGGRGVTLKAEDGDDLLRVIRSEWRKYRRDVAKINRPFF